MRITRTGVAVVAALVFSLSCAAAPGTAELKTTASSDVVDVLRAQFPTIPVSTIRKITEIEGFNDGQELPADGASDNGPIAGLYIVPVRYDDLDFVDTWKLVAVLEVGGYPTAMPMAYKNLGIKDATIRGQYCVYLQKRTAGNKWVGSITLVLAGNCTNPDDGKQLNVAEELEPNTSKSDFPSVVRFDTDKNGKALIGVNCGAQVWCEIGRSPGAANKRDPVHNGLALKTKKHNIKAWHDEQQLNVPASGGKFNRTVVASITPDENLGAYTILDFTSAQGARVATIYLEAPPPAGSKYANWGLSDGNNSMTLLAREQTANPGVFDWFAVFKNKNNVWNNTTFKVTQMKHGINPPAVARWKWNPMDEDIWVACEQGCCIVSGITSLVGVQNPLFRP